MTQMVDIAEAQTKLKDLVRQFVSGAHVVLSENEKPVVQIVPVSARVAGLHAGAISTSEDFDTPLPDEFWSAGQ